MDYNTGINCFLTYFEALFSDASGITYDEVESSVYKKHMTYITSWNGPWVEYRSTELTRKGADWGGYWKELTNATRSQTGSNADVVNWNNNHPEGFDRCYGTHEDTAYSSLWPNPADGYYVYADWLFTTGNMNYNVTKEPITLIGVDTLNKLRALEANGTSTNSAANAGSLQTIRNPDGAYHVKPDKTWRQLGEIDGVCPYGYNYCANHPTYFYYGGKKHCEDHPEDIFILHDDAGGVYFNDNSGTKIYIDQVAIKGRAYWDPP